jgi:hypothetical protein
MDKKQRPIEELSWRRIYIKKQFKDNDQMKPPHNLDFYLTKTTMMWYKNIQIEIVLGLEKKNVTPKCHLQTKMLHQSLL